MEADAEPKNLTLDPGVLVSILTEKYSATFVGTDLH